LVGYYIEGYSYMASGLSVDPGGMTAAPNEEFVVWHGPSLDNVRLELGDRKPRTRRKITQYQWRELDNRAWVADSGTAFESLTSVPKDPERRLLTLSEFMRLFPTEQLNIELKRSVKHRHLKRFVKILEANGIDRVGVVASNYNEWHVTSIRRLTHRRVATNVPILRALLFRIAAVFGLLRFFSLEGWAFELPYHAWITSRSLVNQVRLAGGSTYVFLTAVPFIRALDGPDPEPDPIIEILQRGVDGIMTDFPEPVGRILRTWTGEEKCLKQSTHPR
jgi:glycerophosphoryl diester phosphodiesterase